MRGKWLRVMVLGVIAALVFTMPLTGCKKEQAGGGQSPGGGQGAGDAVGPAFFKFKAGQHLKYKLSMAGGQNGSFTLDISDGGGGKLKVDYAGKFAGQPFSGSVLAGVDTVAQDLATGAGTNPFAAVCLVPLVAVPWNIYFEGGKFETGSKWSQETGGAKLTFEITGTATYAGITGSVGTWTVTSAGQTATCTFCVNPSFPMALQSKVYSAPNVWMEYTLEEATGF
jgi:hypothetical protein